MKRFSDDLVDAEDREFEIGGELFKWRYPHWEELAVILDEDVAALRNGGEPADLTTKVVIEDNIKKILVFVDSVEGAHKRFRDLAKRKENPIPLQMFSQVYRWLLEVSSGRPTEQPSDLEPGAGDTEASSSEGRPSRAVRRKR